MIVTASCRTLTKLLLMILLARLSLLFIQRACLPALIRRLIPLMPLSMKLKRMQTLRQQPRRLQLQNKFKEKILSFPPSPTDGGIFYAHFPSPHRRGRACPALPCKASIRPGNGSGRRPRRPAGQHPPSRKNVGRPVLWPPRRGQAPSLQIHG